MNFLATAGAEADSVAPYVYVSNVDDERVADLIGRIAAGAVDVIAFTSASQVRRLWDVARKRGIEAPLRTGLARAVVAAVGPVTATEATRFGMNPAMPSRLYSMKPLVNEIAAAMQAQHNSASLTKRAAHPRITNNGCPSRIRRGGYEGDHRRSNSPARGAPRAASLTSAG